MNAYTELIDKYLSNELSAEERKAFEEQLKTDPALKTEFDLQSQVVKGVQRMALKKQVKTSFKKTKTTKILTKAVIAAGITVAVLATGYFVKKQLTKENELQYELNEEGNKNWSEADKILPSQLFRIDPTRDTVIESKGGILFAIQAGTFLNKFGEAEKGSIDLEIKEALKPFEIMKSGLSTTSDGRLLETGGMFYINARSGDDNLIIDQQKPIQSGVPYNGKRDDMMLFDGKRMEDGSINWVNPVKTVKQLVTTDITKLNFYPPGYLDSLKKWGYNSRDKKFTDSLYYSFICAYGQTDSVAIPVTLKGKDYTLNQKMEYSEGDAKTGKEIFKANCAVCHSMTDTHLTGPGMKGVVDRVPPGNWLADFIKNSERLIKSGDPYANKILRENGGSAMTVFEGTLTDNQITSLIAYLKAGDKDDPGIIIPEKEQSACDEINPSRIKAIWDPKFNNTFLATRAFEERLQVIFETCEPRILELYLQNLNCELHELDYIAAMLCKEPQRSRFIEFEKRNEGGIRIDNKQMIALQYYANEKRKLYEEAAGKAFRETAEKENKLQELANAEYIKHSVDELRRESKTFSEEFEINLKEAYRQLDIPYNPSPPPTTYISGPVTNTGWKNVDAYVFESTANRTSLDYTDPKSGKKAVIKYQSVKVKIDQRATYDRVVAYLVPDKLSSFQRMKEAGELFSENLNELMKYDIVIIGFKGEKTFYAEIKSAKPQEYMLALNEMKAGELEPRINIGYSGEQRSALLLDFNFQQFEQKESMRQKKIEEREKFKAKVYPIVFPCSSYMIIGENGYPLVQ